MRSNRNRVVRANIVTHRAGIQIRAEPVVEDEVAELPSVVDLPFDEPAPGLADALEATLVGVGEAAIERAPAVEHADDSLNRGLIGCGQRVDFPIAVVFEMPSVHVQDSAPARNAAPAAAGGVARMPGSEAASPAVAGPQSISAMTWAALASSISA